MIQKGLQLSGLILQLKLKRKFVCDRTRVCHLESKKWSREGSIFVVVMGFFQCS